MNNHSLSDLSSAEKRRLLLQALQKNAGGLEEEHPVSLFQEGLLVDTRFTPDTYQYNIPNVLRMRGNLQIQAMEQSINELVKRHLPLRTTFSDKGKGQIRQIVHPFQPQPLPLTDLSTLTPDQREIEAMRLVKNITQKPFRIERDHLIRYHLFSLSATEHWLVFVTHHLIFDLWSLNIFLYELFQLYEAFVAAKPSPLQELAFSYINFARWQQQWQQGEEYTTQMAYWQQQLAGASPLLSLAADRPRPNVSSGKVASLSRPLPATLANALRQLGQQENATLFMVLLAAFNVLLYKYTNQEDIIVGTPVACRNRSETANLVGLLINTLALRSNLSGAPTFLQLLQQVKVMALDSYTHQDLPFSHLIEALQPLQRGQNTVLLSAMFTLNESSPPITLPDLVINFLDMPSEKVYFDIYLIVTQEEQELTTHFEYSRDLFNEDTIERMAGYFQNLLTSLVQKPDLPITHHSLLSATELQQILVSWNTTHHTYPHTRPIHEMLQFQAKIAPDAIAVVDTGRSITYGELNNRANQLARYLCQRGIGLDIPVGLCVERSSDMLVGMAGILKAGGAYVPLDPAHPTERLEAMATDAALSVIITQHHLKSLLPAYQAQMICLDSDWHLIAGESSEEFSLPISPDTMAYVIYTSGSTGTPKGVVVTHRGLTNFLLWHIHTFTITAKDRASQMLSYGLDASIEEIWPILATGACLYLMDEESRISPRLLQRWLLTHNITTCCIPTILAEELLQLPWPEQTTVRVMITGGDTLHRHPDPNTPFILVNGYGPTECTVGATAAIIAPLPQRPSIGRPIPNVQVYVLDSSLQPLPPGIPGELYIGGAGVARGYLHRPDLTAERFIPNPFTTDSTGGTDRLYRTGDQVQYRLDGSLEFLGRLDQQVKIRGYRIELREIETTLLHHPGVREAIVTTYEPIPNERRLIAYVVTSPHLIPTDTELRAYLKQTLPEYMVPASYLLLEHFPLTAHSKVDLQALATLFMKPQATDISSSLEDGIEQTITAIWQEVLDIDEVDPQTNFFDLGGHSLLLEQVHERICTHFDTDLQLIELFQYATVSTQAARIRTGTQTAPPDDPNTQQPTLEPPMEKQQTETDIAIIGMAGQFPGAKNTAQFWENLRDGIESISRFNYAELLEAGNDPLLINTPNFVPAKGIIEGSDLFDADFFDITPRDAEIMDPQQRLLLECSWETLEHAGYDPSRFTERIGVFAGASFSSYLFQNLYPNTELVRTVGLAQCVLLNDKDFLATRISYKLNLRGPSLTIQTACSTSLVAIHTACRSLLNKECEMALAGGVSLPATMKEGYVYREGDIMSPDGHCRAFDAQAQGTVGGSGVGMLLLKPLSAALRAGDHVHAVIKGSALNNDGAMKAGYMAPSPEGQAAVIADALANAHVHPETISYVETHGTGTPLGDPIEIEGLTQAYRAQGAQRTHYCAIGSVKTNIGHLDTASGVAGVIKTVLALQHQQLPPSLHFSQPNPVIQFADSPFMVNTHLIPWHTDHMPRRAGVSSFGIGGTNAHIILEEAPALTNSDASRPQQLLIWSAKSHHALQAMTTNLLHHLQLHDDETLADIAYTLQTGRKAYAHRRVLVCHNREEALHLLAQEEDHPQTDRYQIQESCQLAFLFPGQGSQHTQMARELYETEPTFRAHVDTCASLFQPFLKLDLRQTLFPATEHNATQQLDETWLAQPALFTIEYALARTWQAWGVTPHAMIGHSIGEYVAACLAGVFSLEQAITLVAARGRLLQNCPRGAMLAIFCPLQILQPLLNPDISIAALNAPNASVVAGSTDAIESLQQTLTMRQIPYQRLHTSHAFHSPLVEAAQEPLLAEISKISLAAPTIPFISNVTGTWITAEEATDPAYWVRQLRHTVLFSDGIQTLLSGTIRVFLEVGPGNTLTSLLRQHSAHTPQHLILQSLCHPKEQKSDLALLLWALGRYWRVGGKVDWQSFSAQEHRKRVPLPTYPFERQRYWIAAPRLPHTQPEIHQNSDGQGRITTQNASTFSTISSQEEMSEVTAMVLQAWQEVLGIDPLGLHDDFFAIGGDSLAASRIMSRLKELLQCDIPLSMLFETPTIAELGTRIEDTLIAQMEQEALHD